MNIRYSYISMIWIVSREQSEYLCGRDVFTRGPFKVQLACKTILRQNKTWLRLADVGASLAEVGVMAGWSKQLTGLSA